jgi:hypothetical protein
MCFEDFVSSHPLPLMAKDKANLHPFSIGICSKPFNIYFVTSKKDGSGFYRVVVAENVTNL